MTIIKKLKLIIAAGLLAVSMNASADFINGSITMSGDFEPTGGTSLGDATGIDFLDDNFDVDGVTDDFADAGIMQGDIGTYHDFNFASLTPGTLLWEIGDFSFTLNTVHVEYQSDMFIILQGTGYASALGFDDTFGYWGLSGNGPDPLFSFSAGAVVSEPATLALIGLGIIGLAVARRRSK